MGLLRFASPCPGVVLGHDVVAREYRVGLVARYRARGLLRNAAPDHVADARAPEVMEEQAGDAGRFGERIPCYAEVFDPLAVFAGEDNGIPR